jgi:geranylgeranyl diphosphate synthase type II
VRALELAPDKAALLEALKAPAATPEEKAAKIAAVKAVYVSLGVDKDATGAIAAYSRKAMDAVAGLGLDATKLEALDEFVNSLTGRVK